MFMSTHMICRFREHYPDIPLEDIPLYIRYGEKVSPQIVQVMLHRVRASKEDTYVLSPDRKGLFVVNNGAGIVVTYLRLPVECQDWCLQQWPMAA